MKYERLLTEASQPLNCKLNQVTSASIHICTNRTYVCTYHILQSHTCSGGILLDSLQFLTLRGPEEDSVLQVQPHGCQAEGNYHFSLACQHILANRSLSGVGGIASRVCACFLTRLLSIAAHRLLLHC